jgi:alpha-L-fucosidase
MIPAWGVRDVNGDPVPWETCITLNGHWGYCAKDHNYKSARNVINMLMECVSKGGNLLLNVGPDAKGNIPDESIEILTEVGEWMRLNSEAVYGCGIADIPKHDWGRITKGKGAIYLYIQDTCCEDIAIYGCPYKTKGAVLLADGSYIRMQEPWNAHSYKTNGKVPVFVQTPEFRNLNGKANVIKIYIEE